MVGASSLLSTAGLISFNQGALAYETPVVTGGGSISLSGYNVNLEQGSVLDVSGGALLGAGSSGTIYGNAGSITIAGGQDQDQAVQTIHDGKLLLNATLKGYAGPGASSEP